MAYLEERTIASLSEAREPVRVLNDLYQPTINYCLEREFWNFGYRTVSIDASTTVVPLFGFLYAFKIPTDWVRSRKISSVPTFEPPLLQISEESGFWFTNITPLYVQYNSNDPTYGMNLGMWPASFEDYVALRLAVRAAGRITGKRDLLVGPQGLMALEKHAYKVAAANCAMNEAVGFAPQSSWIRSRRGFQRGLPGPGGDDPTGGSLIP